MKGTEKKVEEWTSEKAKAETEAAAGADAEGGAHLAELIGLHHRKLPQQTLVVFAVHLSMLVCLSLSLTVCYVIYLSAYTNDTLFLHGYFSILFSAYITREGKGKEYVYINKSLHKK